MRGQSIRFPPTISIWRASDQLSVKNLDGFEFGAVAVMFDTLRTLVHSSGPSTCMVADFVVSLATRGPPRWAVTWTLSLPGRPPTSATVLDRIGCLLKIAARGRNKMRMDHVTGRGIRLA